MLFNSFPFLLVFLPAAVLLDRAALRWRPEARLPLLVLASFAFYAWWDWRFLPLLLLSIGLNWLVARAVAGWHAPMLVPLAIAANLLVLAAFKYAGFTAEIAGDLGLPVRAPDWALPLGISFFTFHHIMYLADLRAGLAPPMSLTRYAAYIAFFPQILSGPLVRWREVLHQFERLPTRAPEPDEVARGLLLIVIGLGKKLVLGDGLAPDVDRAFALVHGGGTPGFGAAWEAVLAFSFKIYFDFSGYTDMALGAALLFGITLPQNFETPYRATSLQDFWRRWHMTLSRFLRDYLYIPLGGNRRGLAMQLLALLATMTLGGLWHGAGFGFVLWGCAHGAALCAGLLWRKVVHRVPGLAMPALLGWALTFAFVTLAWVPFRAETLSEAGRIFQAMAGMTYPEAFKPTRTLMLAALVAFLGPTAWAAALRIPQRPLVAAGAGAAFVALLLQLGGSGSYQFIYFQF